MGDGCSHRYEEPRVHQTVQLAKAGQDVLLPQDCLESPCSGLREGQPWLQPRHRMLSQVLHTHIHGALQTDPPWNGGFEFLAGVSLGE